MFCIKSQRLNLLSSLFLFSSSVGFLFSCSVSPPFGSPRLIPDYAADLYISYLWLLFAVFSTWFLRELSQPAADLAAAPEGGSGCVYFSVWDLSPPPSHLCLSSFLLLLPLKLLFISGSWFPMAASLRSSPRPFSLQLNLCVLLRFLDFGSASRLLPSQGWTLNAPRRVSARRNEPLYCLKFSPVHLQQRFSLKHFLVRLFWMFSV